MLERAVHKQVGDYLREHNILSPYQCGFQKHHSTEFAALSLADTIRRNIEQGQLTEAVFIDFRKAFDSIDHHLLLNKLSALEIENQEYAWFESYLHQRTQSVGYQGVFSEPEFITTGVPQGSILMYVNDLPNVVRNCSILMYADDTVLFFANPADLSLMGT